LPSELEYRLKSILHSAFLNAGRHARPTQLTTLRSMLTYLELGQWLASEYPKARPLTVGDDFALFEVARRRIVGRAPLYLEFGVWKGRSMRWWSENLTQADATLVGFDSFEGLPEDWRPGYDAGQFRTGKPPRIHDSRVSFQIGWFEDTLPCFSIPDHDQMIINVDSDLYSSATTVLGWAEPHLRPGTMIYFDEFDDRDHEVRAFKDFRAKSQHEFRPLAIARGGAHWLFEVC
jgi:hypothetical protein